MRKYLAALAVIVFVTPLTGCYTLNHTIGTADPSGTPVASDRQWYILWGLVPLNSVDGGQMAKGKGLTNNYVIQSQMSPLDVLLNIITGFVTVYSRTVSVIPGSAGAASSASPMGSASPQPAMGGGDPMTMGNQAIANKDYAGALQDYQNAASANPNSAVAYQGEGTAYYYLGQKDMAIQAYQKALSLDPSNTSLANFVQQMQGSH